MHEHQDILIKLEKILGEIENLKLQQARLVSDRESEKETVKREHARLQGEIDKLFHIIYSRADGIAFDIDRLKEKEKSRAKKSDDLLKWVYGLGAGVILLVIKEVWELINKK